MASVFDRVMGTSGGIFFRQTMIRRILMFKLFDD